MQRYLKQLLALLRMAKSGGQNSVLTLAAIQAAQQTVLKRPGQAGRILPSLLALATASFSEVQKAGIQKCLRGGLLAVWGVDAPALKAWKPKVRGTRNSGSMRGPKTALPLCKILFHFWVLRVCWECPFNHPAGCNSPGEPRSEGGGFATQR